MILPSLSIVAARRCVPPRSAAKTWPSFACSVFDDLIDFCTFEFSVIARAPLVLLKSPMKNSIAPSIQKQSWQRIDASARRAFRRGSIRRQRRTDIRSDIGEGCAVGDLDRSIESPIGKIDRDQNFFIVAASKVSDDASLVGIAQPLERAASQSIVRFSQRTHLPIEARKFRPALGSRPKHRQLFK